MNEDLARTQLLDHSRTERNGRFPTEVNLTGKVTNPLCGDHVELKLQVLDGTIQDAGFKAVACAICTASSSLLSQEIKHHTTSEVMRWAQSFEDILTAPLSKPWPVDLESFACFEHLRVNHARKACALLPWVALKKAIHS